MKVNKELFTKLIEMSIEQAQMVSDPEKVAMIYANLANAIANSGLLLDNENVISVISDNKKSKEIKENKQENKKEKEIKKEKELEKIEEEIIEAENNIVPIDENEEDPIEEIEESETDKNEKDTIEETEGSTDAWTEELQEQMSDKIIKLQEYIEIYGQDKIVNAVELFSSGNLNSIDDIVPGNIEEFLKFLDEKNEFFSKVGNYIDQFSVEVVEEGISRFSQGILTNVTDLDFGNIEAFTIFMDHVIEENSEE